MFIPNKINVLGQEIEVRVIEGELNENRDYGNFTHSQGLIKVFVDKDSKNEPRIAGTFLHETLEAIRIPIDLKVTHEELTIISQVLFDTIRRNNLDFRKDKDEPEDLKCHCDNDSNVSYHRLQSGLNDKCSVNIGICGNCGYIASHVNLGLKDVEIVDIKIPLKKKGGKK